MHDLARYIPCHDRSARPAALIQISFLPSWYFLILGEPPFSLFVLSPFTLVCYTSLLVGLFARSCFCLTLTVWWCDGKAWRTDLLRECVILRQQRTAFSFFFLLGRYPTPPPSTFRICKRPRSHYPSLRVTFRCFIRFTPFSPVWICLSPTILSPVHFLSVTEDGEQQPADFQNSLAACACMCVCV